MQYSFQALNVPRPGIDPVYRLYRLEDGQEIEWTGSYDLDQLVRQMRNAEKQGFVCLIRNEKGEQIS